MLKALLILTCLIGTAAAGAEGGANGDASGYIGTEKCSACHSDQYIAWKSSRHAKGLEMSSESNKDWIKNCAGCHTTGMDGPASAWNENGVGCEACHGPGQDHMTNGGDKSKIVSGVSADVCGRCHSRNPSGETLMSDGTGWVVGYRPGMRLSDVPGLQMPPLDPAVLPPPPVDNHPLIYNTWKASGHSKNPGRAFTIEGKEWSGPITCVACHKPHQSDNPHQLVASPDNLCGSCHSQLAVLKGKGAKGVEQTRSLHTAISCFECHMTEKNHLMRVLRPDDPELPESRIDTCNACHEVKDRKKRAEQILDWVAWYKETLEPVEADMRIIDEALKNNPDLLNAELKQRLEDTKANLSIIEQDGSEGVHNLDYALEIMSLAKRELAKVKEAIK